MFIHRGKCLIGLHRSVLYVALFVSSVAPAYSQGDCDPKGNARNALDLRHYISITWNDRALVEPCSIAIEDPADDATVKCKEPSQVMGHRGRLRIDVDRSQMKHNWGYHTRGAFSLRGYVDPAFGARRKFEIPGYSTIGEKLQVVQLDLSVASDLVTQLALGAGLAARIVDHEMEARLNELEGERAAILRLLDAEESLLSETELAVRRIYAQALRFQLSGRDILDAAGAIQQAGSRRDLSGDPAAAGRAARLATFSTALSTEQATLEAWLQELLSSENAPYVPILGLIIGRSEAVIRGVGSEVQTLLEQLKDRELSEAARLEAMDKIVAVSRRLLLLEDFIYLHYKNLNDSHYRELIDSPQVQYWLPRRFIDTDFRNVIMTKSGVLASDCGTAENLPEGEDSPDFDPAVIATRRAKSRLDALRSLLDHLAGTAGQQEKISEEAFSRFREQIEQSLQRTKNLLAREKVLTEQIAKATGELRQRRHSSRRCLDKLAAQGEVVEVLLKRQILEALIDRIQPVQLSLDELDVDAGDQVTIVASLIPGDPPPPQHKITFDVVPRGWRGTRPRITEDIAFVRTDEPGADFAARPGVSALWNYYGKSPRPKSAWRALAPGLGISAHFLDFDEDDSTIEVGLGLRYNRKSCMR